MLEVCSSEDYYPNISNWLKVNNRVAGDYVSNHFLIWIDILGYKNHVDYPSGEIYNPQSVKKVDLYLQNRCI